MIISASRRTDIPCYYSGWFMNRLKAGYTLVRNPMNHAQLSRINLSPEVVDCIVFWTKDAKNIIPQIETIDKMGYKFYFQFTLTPYDNSIEKNLRNKTELENTFAELSRIIGKERVVWRYDPIILNETLTIEYHKAQFSRLTEKLSKYTESVIISFLDIYPKLKVKSTDDKNLLRQITSAEEEELSSFIGQTAKSCGLTAKACCESTDLTGFGIKKSSCIDRSLIEKICGYKLNLGADKNQRAGCGCCESIDIGTYNTCINGCIYCYANNNEASTMRRYMSHSPKSELLIGSVNEGEIVKEREVKSSRETQFHLY